MSDFELFTEEEKKLIRDNAKASNVEKVSTYEDYLISHERMDSLFEETVLKQVNEKSK